MKIISFSCRQLNSFLSRKISFFDDVSFLHGINGSGKTTILRAISALLTPDLNWLSNAKYEEVSVEISHNEKDYSISATRIQGNQIALRVDGAESIEELVTSDDMRAVSAVPEEIVYIDVAQAPNVRLKKYIENNRVFSFINSLPNPIFLGLDRTTLTSMDLPLHRLYRGRTVHPYFRTQLDEAIVEAERLLTAQLATLSSERNKLFRELRNRFVLSLFMTPSEEVQDIDHMQEVAEKFDSIQFLVKYALKNIDISATDITATVDPFFDELKKASEAARAAYTLYQESRKDTSDIQSYIDKITPLMNLAPSVSIIEKALEKVDEANKRDTQLTRPLETYRRIMDSFFGDSKKELVFSENAVKVRLPSRQTGDLTSLSSGERQIFVLITHLFFNPEIRGENVLLIDEPELSLHLKWQRQFVDAIREASDNTQMVLATHSPEIIFNRDDRLIELAVN